MQTHQKKRFRPSNMGLFIKRMVVFALPLLVIVGSLIIFTVLSAFKPEPEQKVEEIKAVPVLTATSLQENVTLSVTAQGQVQPRTRIYLVPQVAGRITYMSSKFIEGGKFSKGDVLVRIEAAEYNLRVVQARANVAQAETVLVREKSEAAIARKDWEDIGEGVATPLTLREPQMAEAAARLEGAKAQLKEAELQLSRTTIYAPFSGRVEDRAVDLGEFVSSGMQLGRIYATDVMDVRLPLTNQNLADAGLDVGFIADKENPPLPVTLHANVAGKEKTWSGEIVRTDSGFDTQSRVLFAYVEVKDPFGKGSANGTPLAPGLFVTAKVKGQTLPGAVVVPRNALRGENSVYVVTSDNTLEIKTVNVQSSDRDRVVLSGGLRSGEQVIVSPIRGVADGMKIEVAQTSAAAGGTL